jgi:hypothetical protein
MNQRTLLYDLKGHIVCAIFVFAVAIAPATYARPCVWPRCKNEAVRDAPQLCVEHLRVRDKPEGAQPRDLIWKNDLEGLRRITPIAGPDYLIQGEPPLAYAVYAGNVDAARVFIAAGAYVNWRTPAGQSLVYLAGLHKKIPMAAFLVSAGAGTKEDAMDGLREAQKIAAANRMAGMLLRGVIEDETGIELDKSFDDNWDQMVRDFSNRPAQTPPTRVEPEAEKDHGDEIAIKATVTGIPVGDHLVIRQGPGMNYTDKGRLENGDDVTITGPVTMNEQTDWYPIRGKGIRGWARGKFLRRQ